MLTKSNSDDRLIYNDWFGLFPYHIRNQLYAKAEHRAIKAGEPLFTKGMDGSWLAVVLSGRVRICLHSPDGREMLIGMVEPGEICGERAVFDGFPRSGDAIADTDVAIMIYKRDDLIPAMHSCPETLMYVVRVLSIRLVRYMNTMELLAMQDLPVRLANILIFMQHKHGKEVDGHIVLPFDLTQTDLSRLIGSSRESVNRQLKNFASRGLIRMESGDIEILDAKGLNAICHSDEKAEE